MSGRRYHLTIAAILAVAFLVRCGAAVWWQSRLDSLESRFVFGDSESYWVLATQIATGQPYQYGGADAKVFRVPLYPIMLAPMVDPDNDRGGILWARFFGCLLGTVAVGGIILITGQMFGPAASIAAGGLAACYPGGISMSIFILSEAPFSVLLVANLLLWSAAYRAVNDSGAAGFSFLAGATAGIAILTRPSWLLFTPFAIVLQLLTKRYRRTALMFTCMAIATALMMTPWWIRNYQLTGKFVLTTLQVGASMYDGLNPDATGASDTGMDFNTRFHQQQRAADEDATTLDGTFEYRLDRRMSAAAKAWAIENPGAVAHLAMVKIIRIWRPWPSADEIPGQLIRWVSALGMFVVVIPAAIGAWRHRDCGWPLMLLIVPTLYFTSLHSIFIGSMRYRLPAVFVLTIVAAPIWAQWLGLESRFTQGEVVEE